jgi:hypothetical protein
MSHHLDSELARQDPRLDISDVYVFRGTVGTVLVVNTNPLSGAGGFHPEAMYEFKIDLDGDAVEDLTFRFTFDPPGPHENQRWTLRRLVGPDSRDRAATGEVVLAGVSGDVVVADGGAVQAWAGVAADPFYIEGTVVGAVRAAITAGGRVELDDFDPDGAQNLFAGTDVSAIVLELADDVLPAGSIGFWGTTALATDAGGWRQINRCAHPLINTLFVLEDVERDIDFNQTDPREDRGRYGPKVVEGAMGMVAAMGTAGDPRSHAERLRDTLFPDVLRYEVGTEACFGVERRNGRGLQECSPEVMIELVVGARIPLGLDASVVPAPRGEFPYLAPPHAPGTR